MPRFDLPLAELEAYRPEVQAPPDLVDFWTDTLAEVDRHALTLSVEPVDNQLELIDTYDVTFAGWGGTEVHAWLHLPAGRALDGEPSPTVVQYFGYSRGRGLPHEHTVWAQAGWAQLVMDTRGQGWSSGGASTTGDQAVEAGLVHAPGFLTAGITDPRRYYYRRVYADAMRLLAVADEVPATDGNRLVVTGASQGGGITLAVAGLSALSGRRLRGAAPDVPFLCHFRRAVEITDAEPYAEITVYLAGWRDRADAAYETLSYFDGANLGRYATAPALFSVALMDEVCPPSTVYAAYHRYATLTADEQVPKSITVYPHNRHEGGGPYQVAAQLNWFRERFGQGV